MSGRDSNHRKRGSSENGGWESKESRNKSSHSDRSDVKDEAAKKPKITMGFAKKPDASSLAQAEKKGIQMKLGSQNPTSSTPKPKPTVAAAFNDDSDSEPEEMPPEAKMRMRNIGRETPTSAGPNSFGKTKQGFCDVKKVFEKSLKKAQDNVSSN